MILILFCLLTQQNLPNYVPCSTIQVIQIKPIAFD